MAVLILYFSWYGAIRETWRLTCGSTRLSQTCVLQHCVRSIVLLTYCILIT